MVGFVGALIGGAMKGYGAGQMEEIKQKREEKLKDLDRQFQGQQNDLNRAVQEKQITSQEKLTSAQLAVQRELGLGQQATAKAIAELQEGGQNTRSTNALTTQERIAQMQVDSAKTLQESMIGAQQKLNTRLTAVVKDGKTSYEYLTPDGTPIPKLKGPDGKEYDWAGPDASTDAAKNYNFMIANDIDPKQAAKWAFGAKSGDREAIMTQLLTGMNSSSIVPPNAENQALRQKLAGEGADFIIGHGEAAEAATTAPAATPAPSVQNNATPAPAATTLPDRDLTQAEKNQVIAAAKQALAQNGDPVIIRQKLEQAKIPISAVPGL